MIDRLAIPAQDLIEWDFQVEKQGFITRYGTAGDDRYKQVVLQSGVKSPNLYPVKRISEVVYSIALRTSATT